MGPRQSGRACHHPYRKPTQERNIPKTIMERFLAKVPRRPNRGCWKWAAGTFSDGYGSFKICGRARRANRVSYELHYGPIPAGLVVRHKCDNPQCVRPDHLELGTHAENSQDMVRRGRQFRPAGAANRAARLTEAAVSQMRHAAHAGATIKDLAAEYGVCRSNVAMILNRKRWAHVA